MTPCFVLENKKNNLIEPSEKNIPEHKETNLFKVENYKWKHGCNYKFKTKKQMILHHDKIDSLYESVYCIATSTLVVPTILSM